MSCFQTNAAASTIEECRAQLATAQNCYRKKLDKLNERLARQAAERQALDEQRDACFEQLQYESCLVRSQLQARALSLITSLSPKYCDEYVCLSVVCSHNSKTAWPIFIIVAMAWSSSEGVAIRYIFPVLPWGQWAESSTTLFRSSPGGGTSWTSHNCSVLLTSSECSTGAKSAIYNFLVLMLSRPLVIITSSHARQ